MITAAVVTFHTSRKDLIRLIDCVLHSSIDKFFIIDNSTNDALREFESTSERILIFIVIIWDLEVGIM